jgi:hypothetical protein
MQYILEENLCYYFLLTSRNDVSKSIFMGTSCEYCIVFCFQKDQIYVC